MGISFNCEYCGRKIEAPDGAAGKLGKCPGCHRKLRIPQPQADEDEQLRLAPIDESDLAKEKQLMAETYRLAQDILSERAGPEAPSEAVVTSPSADGDRQLTTNIIMYLRHMADGELDLAEMLEGSIVSCGRRAAKILKQIANSEPPEPELADVPPQVLSGLVKALRSKIG